MAATGPGNIVARRVTDDLIAFSGKTAVLKYMKFFPVQKDQDEVHDSLLAAKDVKRGEERQGMVMSLWRWSAGNEFLTIAPLYILDKLCEVANSSRLEDKIKVVFSRARDSDESFIDLLRKLCSAIRPLEYMREMVARDSARVGVLEQLLAGAHVGMHLKAEYAADMGEKVWDFIVCGVLLGVALMKRRNMTVLFHFISSLFDGNVKVDFAVIWELNLKNPDTGIVDVEMFLDSKCAS
ncbi:hypothetical protein Tco_1192475 [Tanacetum coccineum]